MARNTVLAVLLIAVSACSADSSTDPRRSVGPATVPTTPKDTGRVGLVGIADVSGRVLVNSYRAPTPGNPDTIRVDPVAGAVVKLYHNVLVDGAGVSVYVAEVASGANGTFRFKDVPFGYYLLRSAVTRNAATSNGLSYLAAFAPTVLLDIWVP